LGAREVENDGGIPMAHQRAQEELLRAREALRAREQELELIYSNVSDVIFYLAVEPGEGQYRFVSVNKAFLTATGLAEDQVVGKLVEEVIPQPSLALVLDKYATAIRERQTVRWEETTDYPSGRRVGEVSVTPVFNSAGACTRLIGAVHDITERMASEEVRNRLAAVVESSDDAIISKTLQGIIMTWNKGAERLFGYTSDEVVGKSITILIPGDRQDEEAAILSRLRRGERIEHYETIRLRKDGVPLDVSLVVSPVKDASGRIVGASKIARDITDRKRVAVERERLLAAEVAAREDAERVSLMKDEFLATLSHELRTPLNAILGWSHLLSSGEAGGESEDLRQGLEIIARNARAQSQLVEDLLDMSRIVSGNVRLDVRWAVLVAVIGAAVESVQPSAQAKGIRLLKIIDPSAEALSADPARLQQVVWNLLSNAVKFTPRGGKIEVILARVNSHIEIRVHDTGLGIAPEFLPHVFERFRQADSSSTRRYGGLGLGLAIVKQLVELHGGSVRAQSQGEGRGSTFIVSLPLAPVRMQPQEAAPPTATTEGSQTVTSPDQDGVDLSGIKVLVVDDEPDALDLIKRVLALRQATVITAATAADGLKLLQSDRPDVLVSDIGMPEHDGYHFIRDVRRLPPSAGGRTPAVALTAFARSEDRTRAMMAGYQIHLAKPIEPRELLVTVASLGGRMGGPPGAK
jgi:PAS domain S-box-containing protein